jgi:hypothetical protein
LPRLVSRRIWFRLRGLSGTVSSIRPRDSRRARASLIAPLRLECPRAAAIRAVASGPFSSASRTRRSVSLRTWA